MVTQIGIELFTQLTRLKQTTGLIKKKWKGDSKGKYYKQNGNFIAILDKL